MTTLSKYGKNLNRLLSEFDGLSSDQKPLGSYIEYDDNGNEVGRISIQNGSKFYEIDTGKRYQYDAENQQWREG